MIPITQYYTNLHIQTQKLASCYSATLSYTVFSVAQHMYVHTVLPSAFMIYMWKHPAVLTRNQVNSEWVVLSLNASYYLRMSCVTSECIMWT